MQQIQQKEEKFRKAHGKINWVIGAQTIEMFIKSYKERVSGTSNYDTEYFYSSTPGYKYTTDGTNYNNQTEQDSISPNEANGMYLHHKGSTGGLCLEWMASPHAGFSSWMCYLNGDTHAYLSYRGTDHTIGSCPIVSLDSSFTLEEIE